MELGSGFLWGGRGTELVYRNGAEDIRLSELQWNIQALPYISLYGALTPETVWEKAAFFAALHLKIGIPGLKSTMEDRDWQEPSTGLLTNFSTHDNYTDNAVIFDLEAGATVPIWNIVIIKATAGFSAMHFKWIARDGYLQYATQTGGVYNPWDESLPKVTFTGPAIAYKQTWLAWNLGIAVSIPLDSHFSISATFKAGTGIVCWDQDDHFSRKLQFNDRLFGGIFLEPCIALSFTIPRSGYAVNLYFSYRTITGARGDAYIKTTGPSVSGTTTETKNTAGAGFSTFLTGVSFVMKF
ncbi:hypothetical protein FACS1894164_21330 [Spirochaetia bacterium]|nr:hypothetical protein FACS1894164_21330 [Spirochaetia bacterium]